MKKLLTFIIALAFSSISMAAVECQTDIMKLAQSNMNQIAAHQNRTANINEIFKLVSTKKIELVKGVFETQKTYAVNASIYRGTYNLLITLADECDLRKILVKPDVN
jgi:hypothetical protein